MTWPAILRERRLVEHREVGQHLAVDLDVGALQPGHECAVAHAELAHRGVDARDPQRADRRASCCGGRGRRTAPPSSPPAWRRGRRCSRRPRKPFACLRTFLWRARAVTPRLTLGMARSSTPSTAASRARRACSLSCTSVAPRSWRFRLGRLLGEDVALERLPRLIEPPGRTLNRLAARLLRLHLGHSIAPVDMTPGGRLRGRFDASASLLCPLPAALCCAFAGAFGFPACRLPSSPSPSPAPAFFFGASTITICRPSSRGNCSTDRDGSRSLLHPLQQPHAEFLVRHLAAAEAQRHLRLVAFLEELDQLADLDLVVALVGARAGT